jgi:hypothetical protein
MAAAAEDAKAETAAEDSGISPAEAVRTVVEVVQEDVRAAAATEDADLNHSLY